ncbi:MAG TPA: bifunctional [glutamate--ammonia ligase]-adenylyl-L-tyrosine phosphorylase/[glutamate--ammonia-ligase] adenylyltransferase [Candidatus Udaeobacter sp.]|jgi:glutamate-ammonia-ligase adenylyltransferase|nr:bifunctional [glutamate--ammonia ligase]-adenylyl-L-tyrosine phosphorylase/[glutamate--ammonia-ligase] adenylyltransferase [Candidatus Udaeobacter sp.]
MTNRNWTKAIKACADPSRAKHFLKLLAETSAGPVLQRVSAEQCRIVAALFSGSQALSTWLVANPDLLQLLPPQHLQFPRRKQGLQFELDSALSPLLESRNYATAFTRIREFKQRQMLRIAARDLAHLGHLPEIISEISDVADVCLASVWNVCHRHLVERHGTPYHQGADGGWHPTSACVFGMGKLGGQELNYSSDVDVLFAYADEGAVFKEPPLPSRKTGKQRRKSRSPGVPQPTLNNHQFFNRLAEAFIAEIGRMSPEGMLYRIDLRLRPEGELGPLNRSLSGYENYYAQWGQTWERMMLIKARCVAGDEALAAEFLEMIQPFRYPRSINQGVLREVATMKDRIENEVVKADELERNVKLGRGGIREVEFVVQSLQLLHAGKQPFLQGAQTLPGLEKLAQYELLTKEDARSLADTYRFLRNVEHRLQMDDNRQTHTIPANHDAQVRLASLMGFRSLKEFESARKTHTNNTRRIFDKVLKGEVPEVDMQSPFPRHFEGAESTWTQILADHAFKDIDKAYRVLREFVEGPGFVHVSERTKQLAFNLLPRFLALCPGKVGRESQAQVGLPTAPQKVQPPLSDPDRVVTRLDSFIAAYGARATLFELWNSNLAIFELLVKLFDRSEFLAELAIRTPDLVDELVISGRLRQRKTAEETLADLRHGLADKDQFLWLRRYHQAELMRIGLRDILGLADFEQYLVELSALADACLQYALQVVMRKNKLKTPPFVIIGLGKLGGGEIDYGSDLDIIFVADPKTKNLSTSARFAIQVMELLSTRTEHGLPFHTDARLRPDGEKGLLVNTLKAYEDYYRQRAALWEIQSLTRTRPIAGDLKLGAQFQKLAGTLTNFSRPSQPLTAHSRDWKRKIHQMRMRIEKERTPRGKDELAIKTGAGGLMDAEFIAQSLCLEHGWSEANTLRALERGRDAKVLPRADQLIENYRQLRRVEGILRRWSYEGETVLPDDPAPYYRVSVRCGFASPDAFRKAVAGWRKQIREIYSRVFEL